MRLKSEKPLFFELQQENNVEGETVKKCLILQVYCLIVIYRDIESKESLYFRDLLG